jgi:hypothetical protein
MQKMSAQAQVGKTLKLCKIMQELVQAVPTPQTPTVH